jgi:hypothetical protein
MKASGGSVIMIVEDSMKIYWVEKFRHISIDCLEKHTDVSIHLHIQDWIDTYEPWDNTEVNFSSMSTWINGKYKRRDVVLIGDNDYRPIKWKCPCCDNWNYELTFCDNAGATASCNECNAFLEF